ncbi:MULTISPECIES: hypothetical protein [Sinorhizobium]|uniref:hypothetical protein n=1 Tax=Sinorhizobium TaxID=28105 RepID=UPI0005629590|nr:MULTISPECIES: hypothetical protein [Sinorhizobium]PDT52890.1 hypothetical protein CO664_11110 [Sinorhizobium sp. NG07B]POH29062.1 hypothetical protein ATY30_15600 [Sinorhizobium americanum]
MQARSVIEIVESRGRLPAELIVAGYWASQAGVVVYVLNGVTPQAINLVLDPIVTTLPLSIPGVLYVSLNDKARVCEAVRGADEIYAATGIFRRLTAHYGIAPTLIRSVATAIPRLESRTLQSERDVRAPKIARPHLLMPIPAIHYIRWGASHTSSRHPTKIAI